jgi:hypothetical protein
MVWNEWCKIFNWAKIKDWKAIPGEPNTFELTLEHDVKSQLYKIKSGVPCLGDFDNHTYIKKTVKVKFESQEDSKIIHFLNNAIYNDSKISGKVYLKDISFKFGVLLDDAGKPRKPTQIGPQEVLHNHPERWLIRKGLEAAGREHIPLTIEPGYGTDVLWGKDAFPTI